MILVIKNQEKMLMNCKEVEKNIPKFINRESSPKEEAMIMEHILHCPECKEELTIQFLLKEGINRLENGESFDLNQELEKRLKEHNKPKKKRFLGLDGEKRIIVLDILTGLIIAAIIAVILLWKV